MPGWMRKTMDYLGLTDVDEADEGYDYLDEDGTYDDDVEDAPLEPAAPVSRAADRRVVTTPTVNPVRTLPEPVMPPVDVTKPKIGRAHV